MVQYLSLGQIDGMEQPMRSAYNVIVELPIVVLQPMLMWYLRWKQRASLQQQRILHRELQNVDAVTILNGLECALATVCLAELMANATSIRATINCDFTTSQGQQLNSISLSKC